MLLRLFRVLLVGLLCGGVLPAGAASLRVASGIPLYRRMLTWAMAKKVDAAMAER